jgi:hypothetical protein
MKKSFGLILVLLLSAMVVLQACSKKTEDHSIRVKNDGSSPINTINIVGSAVTFTGIKANTATDYKAIPSGNYTLGGDLESSSPFTISGTGTHKWSIIIADNVPIRIVDEGK